MWNTDAFRLIFKLNESILGDSDASVTITGTDKERVQGIKLQVKEEGDARVETARRVKAEAEAKTKADADFERQEAATGIGDAAAAIFEAEAKRERDRQKDVQGRSSMAPAQPKSAPKPELVRSRISRFISHPVTRGLIVTVVGSVIAALIVAAILSA